MLDISHVALQSYILAVYGLALQDYINFMLLFTGVDQVLHVKLKYFISTQIGICLIMELLSWY